MQAILATDQRRTVALRPRFATKRTTSATNEGTLATNRSFRPEVGLEVQHNKLYEPFCRSCSRIPGESGNIFRSFRNDSSLNRCDTSLLAEIQSRSATNRERSATSQGEVWPITTTATAPAGAAPAPALPAVPGAPPRDPPEMATAPLPALPPAASACGCGRGRAASRRG
jgi:hypothetical protein